MVHLPRGFFINTNQSIVDKERRSKKNDAVYSNKVKAGKRRTYFFDVRQTKGDDYYITLTESTRKFDDGGFNRHKIFLYKEDFNRFLEALQDTVEHVKNDLLPDYDYDEFTRKQEEYERQKAEEENGDSGDSKSAESEDDISW